MLVLERKVNEKIMIGDDIVITLTRVGRRQCWLGVEAPRDVGVHRKEIYDAKKGVKNGQAGVPGGGAGDAGDGRGIPGDARHAGPGPDADAPVAADPAVGGGEAQVPGGD